MTRAASDQASTLTRSFESRFPVLGTLRRLAKNRLSAAGGIVVLMVLAVALLASVIAPYQPDVMQPEARFSPPSAEHWLGADQYGRDIASRLAFGAQVSVYVGALSVGIALTAGVLMGLAAGYYGGKIDEVIMRMMDTILGFPTILLALLLISALGTNLTNVMIAIGIVYTPSFARITRSSVLSVREKEYIEAAKATGVPNRRIVFRHILPNSMAPVIVQTSIALAFAILAEAALSFLGLGAQPPTPSWGSMLAEGRKFMAQGPWQSIFPGLAIALTVFSLNVFGDGLRDALDPRLR